VPGWGVESARVSRDTHAQCRAPGLRGRFGAKGEGAEIRVTRKGNALYEAWGAEEPLEILPGKADAFFARGFSLEERFVRGAQGQVVGIVYTMGDSEVEAKRVP
jgi:hypothetical protein